MPSYLNIRKTNDERLQSCCKLLTYDHPRTVFLIPSGDLYFHDLSKRIVDITFTDATFLKETESFIDAMY